MYREAQDIDVDISTTSRTFDRESDAAIFTTALLRANRTFIQLKLTENKDIKVSWIDKKYFIHFSAIDPIPVDSIDNVMKVSMALLYNNEKFISVMMHDNEYNLYLGGQK